VCCRFCPSCWALASEHRYGPLALAAGLSLSFVVLGLFLATVGHSRGLDAERLSSVAAVLIMAVGAVLLLPPLQARLAFASGPVGNWADSQFGRFQRNTISGQFWIGALLGAVWSPCVGPTLGAASLLAAHGRDLPQVALTMFAFGAGAALPLLALGWVSRETMMQWRSRLLSTGSGMKFALGLLFVTIGMFIVTGLDKLIESKLVETSPPWLVDLTTRF
jgi:cytochrome c-type biogenesis protein